MLIAGVVVDAVVVNDEAEKLVVFVVDELVNGDNVELVLKAGDVNCVVGVLVIVNGRDEVVVDCVVLDVIGINVKLITAGIGHVSKSL